MYARVCERQRERARERVKRIGGKAVYACKSSVLTRCLLFFASAERVGVLRVPLYFIAKGNYICRYVHVHNAKHHVNVHTVTRDPRRGFRFSTRFCTLLNSLRRIESTVHALFAVGRFIENPCICVMYIPINNGSDTGGARCLYRSIASTTVAKIASMRFNFVAARRGRSRARDFRRTTTTDRRHSPENGESTGMVFEIMISG